jgi:hypothetical protein
MIPEHLLYTEGWPRTIPNSSEAPLISEVRREVSRAVGIEICYTEPADVIQRYEQLSVR